jgi:hypothetical protein
MMASMAMAVLPVWRSPMISSRWPRPMGIMASMALMPVCKGSRTGWRSTTPGATTSMGRALARRWGLFHRWVAQGVHHAADHPVAHGHFHDAARPAHFVAFFNQRRFAQQNGAHAFPFQIQNDAHHAVGKRQHFAGHAFPNP